MGHIPLYRDKPFPLLQFQRLPLASHSYPATTYRFRQPPLRPTQIRFCKVSLYSLRLLFISLLATPDGTGHNKKSVESLLARHAHFEAFAMPYPKHNKQLEVHAVYANCLYGLDTVIIHITRTFIVTLCGLEM